MTETERDDVVHGPEPAAPRLYALTVNAEQPGPALTAFFVNGEARAFDLAPLLDFGPFRPLRDPAELLRAAIVEGGHGVVWPCGADLSAEHVYEDGRPITSALAVGRVPAAPVIG